LYVLGETCNAGTLRQRWQPYGLSPWSVHTARAFFRDSSRFLEHTSIFFIFLEHTSIFALGLCILRGLRHFAFDLLR
jgi:hypothetical protein